MKTQIRHRDRGKASTESFLAMMVVAALASILVSVKVRAQGAVIAQIRIEGNQRVSTDAIRVRISQQAGQPLDQSVVDRDVKAIYKMGLFEANGVSAHLETINGQSVLVYRVKERPQVIDVKFEGMEAIRPTDDKIQAAVKVQRGAILDPVRVKDTINGITGVYEDKGYLDAKVNFHEIVEPDNTIEAVFEVDEGPKIAITSIEFTGNAAYSSTQLRAVMETGTHNLLSWFTGSGALAPQKLTQDIDRLHEFYQQNGYLDVAVSQPRVVRQGSDLKISIAISEGALYRFGSVTVAGNLRFPRHELLSLLSIKSGDRFQGAVLQHNLLTLTDFYSNRGYAFVNVDPRTRLDPRARLVDLTYYIEPGGEVLIDRITIAGNTKTADNVIRRELRIQEQEPYSAKAIRDSKVRLDRLGFFSETRITTEPSSHPDMVNLEVNVVERNTAKVSVAGGFDSYSSVFGNFTLGNTNLFGGGESLVATAEVGFLFQNFAISYLEPWFLDMPLSVGMQLFDTKSYLQSFNQSAVGFGLNSTYPLTELGLKRIGPFSLADITAGLGYQFESVGITGLNTLTTYDILRYKGYTQTSELLPSLQRFTVDNVVDPRDGSVLSLNTQFGGLGGTNSFVKGVFHGRYFYPFLKSPTWGTWVLSQALTFGVGTNLAGGNGGEMPLYERFFPGGPQGPGAVRGYQLYSLGPLVSLYNSSGQPVSVQNVGGSKELIFSNEVTFPLLSGLGLRGLLFGDAGQSYMLHQSMNPDSLQASYGFGVIWNSPFAPLRLDIARPINPRPADRSTVFEIGTGVPL